MNARILIAEDEAIISMDLKRTLKYFGFEHVNIVRSAADAVNYALEKRPDLILMDINFKEPLNGIEAANVINSKTRIPIIFISSSRPESFNKEIGKQHYPFIQKPVDAQELNKKIKESLVQ
ncbi:MAG TPA: response regulator [Ignavibacteriaceae bacterium]|nr:response regulator [Ignavibacteriaceae bacterium]